MIISFLLYFSSFDEVSGDHKIGDDVIHENLYELKIKSSPPGLQIDGSGTYEEDSWIVTGIAQQKWGAYEFVGWTVDGKWVDGNPTTVLMNKDHTVIGMYSLHPVKKQDSVNFIQENDNESTFDLTIISSYGKTIGSGSYSKGEIVDFSVSEQYVYDEIHDGVRYAFSGWSDGYTPNLMSNFIKMADSQTIEVNWSKQYRLDISNSIQNKNIISTSWHNENSTAPLVMNNFESKSDGQVKRTINEWISIGSNYAIIKDSKIPITSVVMDNPYVISIDWKNQFYLDVNSKYSKVEGSGFYDEGDVVVASIDSEMQSTGIAGTRLIFDGWHGDINSDGINVQVTMDGPKLLEGVWKKQFQLTVNSEYGIPSGTGWYNEGEVATFGTNIPRDPAGLWQQNTFQGWSGDIETQSNTGSILMNGPKTITAKWNTDYFIAFLNIGLISSTAIGGLLIYKKMKKGAKQEKSLQKDVMESSPIKTKKQSLSRLTKELSTKINSKMNFSDNQETIQNNKLEEILENIELQKEKMSQEKEQLEKSVAEVELGKRKIAIDLEKKVNAVELERKELEIEFRKKHGEVELQKNSLSQKEEELEKSIKEVDLEKKNASQEKEQLEKSITAVELEKKKLSSELERKEAAIELEEKRLSEKAWELEKRIGKFTLEMNKSAIELEKKRIAAELERKELVIELEKEHLSQRKKELEKSIAAVEIEKDIAPAEIEIQKNTKLNKKNISPNSKDLKNIIAEIELARKISSVELERKESIIELEKKNLATKTEMLEKRTFGIEIERKISSVQLERIEAEIELEKKNLEQRKMEFGKNTAFRNTNLMKKDWDYSYSILDSEHNSYEKFRQWANVLEHEPAIKETSDKENIQDVYLDDRK